MSSVIIAGDTSGTVTLAAPAVSGTTTLTLPATTGTVALTASPTFTGQATIPTINLTGGQITFPATQSASTDANTLDDYEEGTWSGSLTGVNLTGLSLASAKYTKVGRLVTLTAAVSCTVTSSNVLTYVTIVGYPFAPTNETIGSALLNTNVRCGTSQIAGVSVYAFFPAASAPVAGSETIWINISYFAS